MKIAAAFVALAIISASTCVSAEDYPSRPIRIVVSTSAGGITDVAPYLPDVPTFGEQGFPGLETTTWFALFAPQAKAFADLVQADAAKWARIVHEVGVTLD